jgi:nicotinamidase-related amidase
MKALIVIDLQNEFLSVDGRFQILDTCKESLLQNLPPVVSHFREQGQVVWIRAVYENKPAPSAISSSTSESQEDSSRNDKTYLLSGTHYGNTPCCPEGTTNANFHPDVQRLIDQKDTIITKGNYSAFNDTPLLAHLQSHNVTNLYFCGLLSHTCVLGSVMAAVKLASFNVYVIEDCLGWTRVKGHQDALAHYKRLSVSLVQSGDICGSDMSMELPKLYYVNGSIPSWRVQMALYEKVEYNHDPFFIS